MRERGGSECIIIPRALQPGSFYPEEHYSHATFLSLGSLVTCGGRTSNHSITRECLFLRPSSNPSWERGVVGDIGGERERPLVVKLATGVFLLGTTLTPRPPPTLATCSPASSCPTLTSLGNKDLLCLSLLSEDVLLLYLVISSLSLDFMAFVSLTQKLLALSVRTAGFLPQNGLDCQQKDQTLPAP